MLFGFTSRSRLLVLKRLQQSQRQPQPYHQQRSKVTLIQHDFADGVKVKRPLPIVLVQSSQDLDTSWPLRWQQKLGELGYRSSYIHLEQEQAGASTTSPLDIWYKDLVQAMQEHSYFPPLLIGHGDEAWKTCQKYVCNKPVSGLVLIHQQEEEEEEEDDTNDNKLPSMEFEPHFPLCLISPMNKVPVFLQDDNVDHLDTLTINKEDYHDSVLKHTLNWMDDANM
ncbi:hypothetical protein BC941DRAFT_451251 [Chlamydoabsidia padenii]|nr:hypothetical protein BC941DRAFT_451251 [Chlamydoabsidia padenii]